ncbi:MAG: radical SAM protein [Bacteroidales bacterium]|nr:radical SAM protein [Bacteroidales bacterium]
MYTTDEQDLLSRCTLCPRECLADRFAVSNGYCGTDAGINAVSVCLHKGEEPVICGDRGICNIFFSGCNLRCIYCQNHEISWPGGITGLMSLEETLDAIEKVLLQGVKTIGFVSPMHVVPQVKAIIRGLNGRGLRPVTVYNTNGYEKPETIDSLDEIIDVWLCDYKYAGGNIASELSDVRDYPETVLKALKRMYFLKGSTLQTDNDGMAISGLIIRHLIIPGHVNESIKVLRNIAEELSTGVHVSIMSQYSPTAPVSSMKNLGRQLSQHEYDSVVKEMEALGFRNGWIQESGSSFNYMPDFTKHDPFE